MAIKKIQLRGISRNPSDRMTSDGGCSESLNVYLDNDELAPVLVPKDISAQIHLPGQANIEDIYLHKTSNSENYILICKYDDTLQFKEHNPILGWQTILELEKNETLKDIASLGNTLIVTGSQKVYYIIYRDEKYEFLGNAIPHIPFELKPTIYDTHPSKKDKFSVTIFSTKTDKLLEEEDGSSLLDLSAENWNNAIARNSPNLPMLRKNFWDGFQLEVNKLVKGGLFYYPVLVRYAIKLHDNSYIYQSTPLLMGAGFRRMMECELKNAIIVDTDTMDSEGAITVTCALNQAYTINARMFPPLDLDKWKDIIQSIDLFVSEPLMYPTINSDFFRVEDQDGKKVLAFQNAIGSDAEDETIKDTILAASNFYKIHSFPISNRGDIVTGEEIKNKVEFLMTEKLYTHDRLPDDFRSNHSYIPSKVTTFNNRILASGMIERIYGGEPNPNALVATSSYFSDEKIEIMYEVVDSDGTSLFVKTKGIYDNDAVSLPPIVNVKSETNNELMSSYHAGFVAYPDTRCVAMYFRFPGFSWKKIPMFPHPNLQCAYAYLGIDQNIVTIPDLEQFTDLVENNTSRAYASEYLFQSALDNPFFFPASGRKKLSGEIYAFAIATTALSQGQFGQFPLYLFTSEGIWTMQTTEDGMLKAPTFVTHDVCSNPQSVTSLDKDIVFVSDKGLMLLRGSEVVNLSPYMNGRHLSIDGTSSSIIESQYGFDNLLEAAVDKDAFMTFMKDARIGYDYTGERIICFNQDKPYQYVYKLNTQTWHKVMHSYIINPKPINSYPECLVMVTDPEGKRLLDFSTDLSNLERDTEKAIIATRPFDLGEPDVLKTITDVRVRGQLPRTAVKFILLGSQDGINFRVISTLRGKSWKLFRIILLADLDATDRISWIDVQYETRFTNKLR